MCSSYITTHACERFLERELGYITWTVDDINRVRQYLKTFISSHRHKNLDKKESKIWHVLVDKLVLVFTKAKKVLITLYPFKEQSDKELIDYSKERFDCSKAKNNNTSDLHIFEESNIPKKFKVLGVKGYYPNPSLLSVSITETKKKIHITVNDPKKSYNPSGCFCSVENAERFIKRYTEFYYSYLKEKLIKFV